MSFQFWTQSRRKETDKNEYKESTAIKKIGNVGVGNNKKKIYEANEKLFWANIWMVETATTRGQQMNRLEIENQNKEKSI